MTGHFLQCNNRRTTFEYAKDLLAVYTHARERRGHSTESKAGKGIITRSVLFTNTNNRLPVMKPGLKS